MKLVSLYKKKALLLTLFLGMIAYFLSMQQKQQNSVGVYWGAFDPPTVAHKAIILTALKNIPLRKIIVVVNNHNYKTYTYPLTERIKLIESLLGSEKRIEIVYQDDDNKLDFMALKQRVSEPLCAIAGYDAYVNWVKHSLPESRSLYDGIAVVPRGDEPAILVDANAFLLPISSEYKDVSSTKLRESDPLDHFGQLKFILEN